MHEYCWIKKTNLTVHNCLERFLQVSIRPLEVLVIIAAPKGAIVHQLQGDMHGDTFISGYDVPVFVYMVEDSLFGHSVSSGRYTMAQYAHLKQRPAENGQQKCTQYCCSCCG